MVSPNCTLLFSRKETIKFFEVALGYLSISIVWSVAMWSRKDIGLEILPILQRILYACLSNWAIKTIKQNVKFVQTLFYLPFGCPKTNFGSLSTRQPNSPNFNHSTISSKTWKSLVMRLGPRAWLSASVGFELETFRFRV